MKIQLEYPFSKDWRLGYLVTNKEPRRNVILFNNKKDRSTVSYARYLMSCHLKRYLERHEIVDHINNDKLDDRLDNYQIITAKYNISKSSTGITYVDYVCPVCGVQFKLEARQSHRTAPCCSRRCGGIKSHWSK